MLFKNEVNLESQIREKYEALKKYKVKSIIYDIRKKSVERKFLYNFYKFHHNDFIIAFSISNILTSFFQKYSHSKTNWKQSPFIINETIQRSEKV